jgi:transposase
VYRRLLKLALEKLRLIEDHLSQLDQQMADLLAEHHDAVQRLAEIPGLGVDSAQQIIAEVGATAATFPSPKHLASWMGACRYQIQLDLHAMSVSAGRWETSRRCKAASVPLRLSQDR